MAADDKVTKRSLTVLAVVVACFAVLWPKIFYPMVYSIIFPSDDYGVSESMSNYNFPKMLHPHMREAMGETRPSDKMSKEGSRALLHPFIRQFTKPQSKGAGAMNLVVPVYTIGIIFFFVYTLIKMLLKKPAEETNSYPKTIPLSSKVCKYTEVEETPSANKKKEKPQERKTQHALEQYGKDKVLTALKTIILEMEDFKENFAEAERSKVKLDGEAEIDRSKKSPVNPNMPNNYTNLIMCCSKT